VYAADVDGDGDTDVLSASAVDDKIAWYQNDGSENFTAHTVATAANGARNVFAADVDGDGDTDVLSASYLDDKIAWYENDGSENFTAYTISIVANGATSVYAADVDGDGDLDVLSASAVDDKIAWYENLMPKPKKDGGLDDLPRDPYVPPLPAPSSPPSARPAAIVMRSLGTVAEPETVNVRDGSKSVIRLSTIKRLADVDWASIFHDDVPLFGAW
jgi:hypothetical protein